MIESRVSLFEHIVAWENLHDAWERVRENRGCPGVDGVRIEAFHAAHEVYLARLQRELKTGAYSPLPLLKVLVAKPNGESRGLTVPTVRDRVAQAAVYQVLLPIFEREFEDCSFGYRPGRSVRQAVYRVREYRERGYRWVVDADIDGYFDNIDHALLFQKLRRLVSDEMVLRLIAGWVRAVVWDGRAFSTRVKGIPQGAVISPLLANLFLDELDEALLDKGYKLVRYADDFIILCKTRPQAEAALELTDTVLEGMELELDDEDTRVTSFDAGFRFLGVLFVRSLAWIPLDKPPRDRRVLCYPDLPDLRRHRHSLKATRPPVP